ncbi:MAG: hypothetical protein QM786_09950 [Breznakibacter sp.]
MAMRFRLPIVVAALAVALSGGLSAQNGNDQITIDDKGVMRWATDGSEIHGFGINYTLPFAHEYRMAQRTGTSHEEAVKQDVYHMARLDLDLYRVHVWDTEISDTLGNLLSNDHLRLFDFTVNEMKKRGMKFVITPIAFWGNGWPEPDTPTPGFAYKYGKADCLTNPGAIDAQANYLSQFLDHVNVYTGVAYKDEPSLLAFEISNEPHHGGTVDETKTYINKMVASMRYTGCTKPIFYNMSHSIHLAEAYLDANVQGGTFQWYPTNLVANQQIDGNFLPHVQRYVIPFADHPKFKKMAKIVYEFDPADAGGNIMYPVMAQSFREAGMQLGAQFAYDAMCWAPYNTNYGTHFMNLAYAPQKAISLKIASAVFHQAPLYQDRKANGALRISYVNDLAEWVTSDKFFYTNNTQTHPDESKLKEIAGYGSSPLISYNGTGAYFADRLSDGVWRIEVMPDAYWVNDPYSKVTPHKQKAAVRHSLRQMTMKLPGLGNDFEIRPIDQGNVFKTNVSQGSFDIRPGVYLLTRKGVAGNFPPSQAYKNISIGEFVAPAANLHETALWNHTPDEKTAGKPFAISFKAVDPSEIKGISVVMNLGGNWKTVKASANGTDSYQAEVPSELSSAGFLQYRIIIETAKDTVTFPGGKKGDPWSWMNSDNNTYSVRIVPAQSALAIWEAESDWEASYKIWNRQVNLVPTSNGETALSLRLPRLPETDPAFTGKRNYAFKFFFGHKIEGRRDELAKKRYLVIKAANSSTSPQPVTIGLIDQNGTVRSGTITIKPNKQLYKLELNKLSASPFLVIPRPFPDYLPYSVDTNAQPFDPLAVETLQVMVEEGKQAAVDLEIEKIWME